MKKIRDLGASFDVVKKKTQKQNEAASVLNFFDLPAILFSSGTPLLSPHAVVFATLSLQRLSHADRLWNTGSFLRFDISLMTSDSR